MVASHSLGEWVLGFSLSPMLPVAELGPPHVPHLLWKDLVLGAQHRGQGLLSLRPWSLRTWEGA